MPRSPVSARIALPLCALVLAASVGCWQPPTVSSMPTPTNLGPVEFRLNALESQAASTAQRMDALQSIEQRLGYLERRTKIVAGQLAEMNAAIVLANQRISMLLEKEGVSPSFTAEEQSQIDQVAHEDEVSDAAGGR